jgi:hypothetical protein
VLRLIHGVGAETPTQLLIFLFVANLGGIRRSSMGLAAFIGLLITNLIMCATAAG